MSEKLTEPITDVNDMDGDKLHGRGQANTRRSLPELLGRASGGGYFRGRVEET